MLRSNNPKHDTNRKITIDILGGGLGGLVVASILSYYERVNCSILEQNDLPGGRVHGVWIDQNYYDIGATIIVPRLIQLLKSLGIHTPTHNFDLDLILTENRIPIRFPIRRQTWKDIQILFSSHRHKIFSDILRIFSHPTPARNESVLSYLWRMDLQSEALLIICSMFAISGTPPSQIKAGAIIGSGYAKNLYYPIGGTMQIPLKLLEKVKKQGGLFLNRWNVESINISDSNAVKVSNLFEERKSDLVISNIGILNTLRKFQNIEEKKRCLGHLLKNISPAIPLTTFLFNTKKKPQFIARCPFNVYFPFNTFIELDQYLLDLSNGKNPIKGFYFHFPSLIDRSITKVGDYPLSVFVPSSINSSKNWVNRVKEYLIEEINRFFIPNFKDTFDLVKIFNVNWYKKRFGGSAAITPISPASDLPPINPRISKNIYLTGNGVYRIPSSLVQAIQSGIYVSKSIIYEKLNL